MSDATAMTTSKGPTLSVTLIGVGGEVTRTAPTERMSKIAT